MKDLDFIAKAKDIANNYKTLYIMGCFGAPMSDKNKQRYTRNHPYNRRVDRTKKINAASRDTFGFDCVCLIKGILWGWNGDVNKTYGGAVYSSNGVPDVSADQMMKHCTCRFNDFSNIVPGEVVHMPGHIGIYIGDGLAVECTPIWKDGVQITAVGNIGKKEGYPTRTWVEHGKLRFIDYTNKPEPPKPEPTPCDKFNIGDEVIINGPLYTSANADRPNGNVSNKQTVITRKVCGTAHPYNTTGDLGWMDESSITKYIKPEPPKPEPLKVGDTVKIIGTGNGSTYGSSNTAYGIGWTRTILRIWDNKPFPYQVGNNTGTTGFYKADALEKK